MTLDEIREDWKIGEVTRAIEYCPHCEQETKAGVVTFEDGSAAALRTGYMHRDGSFASKFVEGALVAKRKDSEGFSLLEILRRS